MEGLCIAMRIGLRKEKDNMEIGIVRNLYVKADEIKYKLLYKRLSNVLEDATSKFFWGELRIKKQTSSIFKRNNCEKKS